MKLYDVLQKNKTIKPVDSEPEYIAPKKPRSTLTHIVFWGSVGIVLAIIYSVGINYARASVHVSERKIPFSLTDARFTLVHESKAVAGDIPFQIVLVSDSAQREVIGTQAPFTTINIPKAKTTPVKTTVIKNGKKVTITTQVPVTTPQPPKVFTYQLADSEREGVANILSADIYERLKRQTRTQIPEGVVLAPDLQFFSFDRSHIIFTGDKIAFPAIARGSLASYLIDKSVLEQAIASVVLRGEESYPEVSILEIGSLKISPISAAPLDLNDIPDTFTVSITGQGTLITKVLPEDIQKELAGAPRKNFEAIVSKNKEINTASFAIYPFWATRFPLEKNRITIKVD